MIMATLRLLNDGTWSKPPVLMAARKLIIAGLSKFTKAKPLGEMASFLNGTSYDRRLLSEGGIPIIRISNVSNPKSEYISTLQQFDPKYSVAHGDLLVSWSASFKSIIWPGPNGILNQHIFKVTEIAGHHRGYIRHAIEAVFDEMQQKVVGIGMMHLRRGDFLGHLVPAPTFETQKRINEFLDWVESGCDGVRPELPATLETYGSMVARIEQLSAKIEEARGLRNQALGETEAFFRSAISALPFSDQSWTNVRAAVL